MSDLRAVFNRRLISAISDAGIAVERQAKQIQNVLSGIQWLTIHARDEHRDNVVPACLRMLLAVADQLLCGCYAPGLVKLAILTIM